MGNKNIGLNLDGLDFSRECLEIYTQELQRGQQRLESGQEEFTGWYRLPFDYDRTELQRILEAAEEIRKKCTVFVVIGIGGSYLGTRAAVEWLEPAAKAGFPKICFAGQNISSRYHRSLLKELRDKDICLCVISKSGTTAEPSIAFGILKEFLIEKYGREEAGNRIYVITDREKGVLREETNREGYKSFVVPDDIGGRYSVLSAVGLLPIAAAGIDVKRMLEGAAAEAGRVSSGENGSELPKNPKMCYAAARNELYKRGKIIEVFEAYEPSLASFIEWLKQLFGESEGKCGKGIFPAGLQFSTDLHSMGQFLQEGNPVVFETILNVEDPGEDLIIPEGAGAALAGKGMSEVNRAALQGVTAAHRKAGISVIRIDLPKADPFVFGSAVWFFERACALSAYLLGVTPFDQPGVEQYKAEMRSVLEKE